MVGRGAILIAGPTASGKSAEALRLAHELDGMIVNADSMQVYRELRILTARPSREDEIAVRHFLYGHVGAREWYSVARWLDDVKVALEEIEGLGKRAIIVGGTGLYFKALTEGLAPIPDIPADVRKFWREEGRLRPPHELHEELTRRDPLSAAGIRPSDPQRIIRALEVIDSTGRPLAEFQEAPGQPLLAPGSFEGIVMLPERATLHERADTRFDTMIAEGALGEVEQLQAMQLDSDLPAMRALGVAPLLSHLKGEATLEDAVVRGKVMTRQYIKRQTTWLKKHMISWSGSKN
ncbi:MAG: tRNA (adenosine(37)-N6)-dimethylallyltransferase MiaA [Alphaproteobacteria bacterium]|nr:tRNA (adenosine(37)-N6)-dimethylallyltransferase MiaA [Alphaproteobacteria bacterium]